MTSPRCPEGYFPFLLRHQPFVRPVSHWVFPVKILHWSVLSLPLQLLVVLFVFTIKFCISVPLVQNLTHNVFKHFLFLKKFSLVGSIMFYLILKSKSISQSMLQRHYYLYQFTASSNFWYCHTHVLHSASHFVWPYRNNIEMICCVA